MSGFEVFGLVSGIVSIVEATMKVYRSAQNSSELPEAFHWAALRLPLLQNTLSSVEGRLADPGNLRSVPNQEAVEATLRACSDKAEALRTIFTDTIAAQGAPWLERWKRGRLQLKMADRVRDLVSEMDKDLHALVGNQVLGGVMTEAEGANNQRPDTETPQEGYETSGSGWQRSQSMHFYNMGTGHQVVHAGHGDQVNNFGSGRLLHMPHSASLRTRSHS